MFQLFKAIMAHIKTEQQYNAIMKRIDQLFFETDETTSSDDPRLVELDLLSSLIEEYEKENYPIEIPTLSETMNARLVEYNITQKEMAIMLGMTAPRLSAILGGKANPTFEQARVISLKLNIPPAIVLA
jgi:HTH-type transcriptional regulator/antitoxin HigA